MKLYFPFTILSDIAWGLKCKYSLCCIANYIIDDYIKFKNPYEHRLKKYDIKEYGYVPCAFHCKYILKCGEKKDV